MRFFGVRLADRRDEAVAAVLAGAVVVILGFASGLGVRTADADQPTADAPPAQVPVHPRTPASPVTQVPPAGAGSVGGGGGVSGGGSHPSGGGPVTGPKPSPTPSTGPVEPTPGPTVSCPPGLVGSLPVVGPLVAGPPTPAPVPALLGSLPLVGPLVAPAKPGQPAGILSCPVGVLIGPSCCATAKVPTP